MSLSMSFSVSSLSVSFFSVFVSVSVPLFVFFCLFLSVSLCVFVGLLSYRKFGVNNRGGSVVTCVLFSNRI
jgi:hypothetical protein